MLDSKLAQAHAARGYIGALANAPTDQVAADFGRASALQPNAPSIPSWSARVLAKQGRVDEALAEAQRAADLDPKSASRHIAVAYWALRLGHYDRAAQASREALALEPELILPRALMARALLLGGRAAECLELDLGPHTVLAATCRHALGRAAEAQAMVDSVEADLRRGVRRDRRFTDVLWAEDLAVHYAWLGEADRALEWLARAYEMSPSGVETMVLESALFDRVRDAPLFARDVSRIRAGLWDRVRR
ncbi:hypothetical protein [Hydrogenophaga sp.]|uniref:hypothetical protein n=1 Tax=Hydrogenophaga sp. TaxID=1904254 RepID=UPI0016B98F2D|nr:hypothetical protein [Hydrogenophaga sp.]NIS99302.1 hypothetical protein [Hydrogenophaga sp.]